MSAAPRRPRAASASAKSGAAGAKRARAASAESAGAPVAAAEAKPETATVEETGEAERDEAVPLEPEVLDVGAESAELPDFVPEAATPAETARAERALTVAAPREKSLPVPADPLARYIQEARRFPELDREEERRLARLYRATGDPEAARRLITSQLMLVVKLAFMYRRAIRNVLDLIQEGNVGLVEALKRFDPEQNVRFPTYAAWWIKAYMLKFLLDNARLVRVGTTNARRKLLYNLRREKERLEREGISPTPPLLAERFGVAEEDVVEVERALSGGDVSMDMPLTEDGDITVGDTLHAEAAPADEVVAEEEIRDRISAAVAEFREGLGEREQAILDGRLVAEQPQTLQELGDQFGVTREAMRQSENKLKERLARFLRERLGDEIVLRFSRR
ncbi:MAG: sigma-70 family RNA polymerase sigma factor [Candidatus Polarisedimenticolia bacterium]